MKTFEEKVAEDLRAQIDTWLQARAMEIKSGDESMLEKDLPEAEQLHTFLAPRVAAAIDRAVPEYAVRHLDNHRRRARKALKETA